MTTACVKKQKKYNNESKREEANREDRNAAHVLSVIDR